MKKERDRAQLHAKLAGWRGKRRTTAPRDVIQRVGGVSIFPFIGILLLETVCDRTSECMRDQFDIWRGDISTQPSDPTFESGGDERERECNVQTHSNSVRPIESSLVVQRIQCSKRNRESGVARFDGTSSSAVTTATITTTSEKDWVYTEQHEVVEDSVCSSF
jgi:hypothetical protein